MGAKLEKKENSVVVLTMEASKEDFAEAVQKSFNKNKNRFQIPGFRKGKAPFHLVKQYYGEGALYDDAIDIIVNAGYRAAVEEHDLNVVSKPEMDIIDVSPEKGLQYTVTVTVRPEVKLGNYLGVEAPYHYHEPDEEDAEKEIERIRERNSRLIAVDDRPARNGDTVTIDYEGFTDGVAFEGGKAEGYDLKIGSGSFIPGFEEQIVGHKTDDEFSITVQFPEEYQSDELKGKEATFVIHLHAIREKELPKLDDEFAKDVSEFDSLEEYRNDILLKMREQARKRAEEEYKNSVVQAVCDNATVEIPACMIETEVEQMQKDQSMRMRQQGIELEQYLQFSNQTMEDFRKSLEPIAHIRVKSDLVLDSIAKEMAVEAAEEDIEAEIERIAGQYGMQKDDLKKRITGNDAFIRESVIVQKTIDILTAAAIKIDPHHDHEEHPATKKKTDKKTDKTVAAEKPDAKKTSAKKTSDAATKDKSDKATTKKASSEEILGKPEAKKASAKKKSLQE